MCELYYDTYQRDELKHQKKRIIRKAPGIARDINSTAIKREYSEFMLISIVQNLLEKESVERPCCAPRESDLRDANSK